MELIKSPMNYVGGKYKLLPQILEIFPDNIDTFVDLFGGGLDVSINVKANNVITNDIITPIINLYEHWKYNSIEIIISNIESTIKEYNLTKDNLDGYLKIRENYNYNKDISLLFPIIAFCYNNQIRFNSKWEFNRHFGKNRSSFNDSMKKNLIDTLNKIHTKNIKFKNKDIFDIDFSKFKSNHFVYCDPPYLITYADYSIQASWNEDKEWKLLEILDCLDNNGVRFALSNVLEHGNKTNIILKEWSKKYKVHHLNFNYTNANADKKDKTSKSDEVLITNY